MSTPDQKNEERILTFGDAVKEALAEEMRRDERVFMVGEDIAEAGTAFKVLLGLVDEFGPDRIMDSPISEAGITGLGVGAAMTGMRPVVDIMFGDFITLTMDQMVNQAAKIHYMSGGKLKVPIVLRTTLGGSRRSAGQHSQSLHAWFSHVPGLKVAVPATPYDAKGLMKSAIRDDNPEERGLLNEPLGIDVVEPPVLFALQREGINVVDGQQLMQQARMIKTQDEISLLNMACMMVDAAYEELYRMMRPGVRENECVGLVNKVLYDLGSEHVEGVNAISGERCSPHPHVFSNRVLRPGDPAYFDVLHSYMGYRTCYYRTFVLGSASQAQIDAYKRCRYYLDIAIDTIKPGVTTADVAKLWPKAEEFGFPNEEAAFALQYGHGVGLAIWEKPVFSRLVSLDHPDVIEEGMVFALETFWPASDGWSAARIEEQLVVTVDGCEVITRFPAEELMVAGVPYYTATGPLSPTRDTESHKNLQYGDGSSPWKTARSNGGLQGAVVAGAKSEAA
jgi:pyruvate/2-oxoglutarate/acetoin dehydrogenase E1 component